MIDRDSARRAVEQALETHGLLAVHHGAWPAVTTIVAGEPVRGSWWGHAAGHEIYDVLMNLGGDIHQVKLLAGRVTLVHPRLWPHVITVGSSGEEWQTRGLRADAVTVFEQVRRADVQSDALQVKGGRKRGAVVTDLERRLLVHSVQVHTESGRHARQLRDWSRVDPHAPRGPVEAARAALEAAGESLGAAGAMPWS